METIRLLVRNIVFVILLGAFLEMLLPLRETRRFLEVIVGLFVLITILNPLVALLRQEPLLGFEIQETGSKGQLEAILDQGKDLQKVQSAQSRAAYGEQLEKQIAALARMVSGVSQAKAAVQFSTDPSLEAAGVIERVDLVIKKAEQEPIVEPVEKVEVSTGSVEQVEQFTGGDQEILDQVQENVASLFGLRPEQVSVTFEKLR